MCAWSGEAMAECGVCYVVFGQAAAREAARSRASVPPQYPVCVVGDTSIPDAQLIPWRGPDPFDHSDRRKFQFRAVYPKSALAELVPFERCLYLDVDTEVVADPAPAFAMLDRWDVVLTTHIVCHLVGELWSAPNAGWYHNRRERDTTVREWGDGDMPYVNSGVIFWRRTAAVRRLMSAWREEWQRFRQWDEQLALMRAWRRTAVSAMVLPVGWNAPHREQAAYIYHAYGRGHARSDREPPPVPGRDRYRGIVTYSTAEERALLARLAAEVPAGGCIVEVGCLYGGMTALLAESAPQATVTAVDIFEWHPDGQASVDVARANLRQVGVTNASVVETDSRRFATAWQRPVDLVFIDGGHSYTACLADLCAWEQKARVMACHDYRSPAWQSVTRAVDDFCRLSAWQVSETAGTLAVLRRKEA